VKNMKKLSKRIGIALGLLLIVGGVAYAAFTFTYSVSSNNSVTSASAGLEITASQIDMDALVAGGSTPGSAMTVKNVGAYAGNVSYKITFSNGLLCPDLTLAISGDRTAQFSPIANGVVSLGSIAPGETLNLVQTVSLSANSTKYDDECEWSTQAIFSDQ
jgi:hypothetical protein